MAGFGRQRSNEMDMLHGSLWSKIILFALPLALSSVLQQFFNSADMAVVGRYAGGRALAAVGSNGPVIGLLINLFLGLSVGANVVIAHHIGRGDRESVRDAVHTVIVISFASGMILLLIGVLGARTILTIMGAPDEILDLAVLYLRILCVSMPFTLAYNFGSAILRSVGDTRRPLYCLIASGMINVALNLVLVIVFELSVVGVAVATVVSQIIASAAVFWLLLHESGSVRVELKLLGVTKNELIRVFRIGIPAGLQGVVFSLSNVCIQSALNGLGYAVVAGSAASLSLEIFSFFVVVSFNQAAVTFTSQNWGAGKLDRCRQVYRITLICAILAVMIMDGSVLIFKEAVIGLFTEDPAVAELAFSRMKIVLTTHFLIATYEITASVMRGFGYSMTPSMITIFGTCALRLLWVWGVFPYFSSYSLLLAIYPISWIITGTAMIIAYRITSKKVYGIAPAPLA